MRKEWTEEEIEFLKENRALPKNILADKLGHSIASVKDKFYNLKLQDTTLSFKEKMKIVNKEINSRPEVIKQASERMKLRWQSDKYKQDMSNMSKKIWDEKRKIEHSLFMKNLWKDKDYIDKRSKALKKAMSKLEYKEKMAHISKETQNRPDVKTKHSQKMKEKWSDDKFRKDTVAIMKEKANTAESKEKHSKIMKEKWRNDSKFRAETSQKIKINKNKPENKERFIKMMQDHYKNPKFMEKLCRIAKENNNRPEVRKKMSEHFKKLMQNPDYKNHIIRATRQSGRGKPNKKEQFLDSLIQQYFPNEYKLNVKADTILNSKIPDWINCNGQKKVILFNGIYWHLWMHQKSNPNLTKEQVEEKERKPYNELGYNVCFIWEDELKNIDKVLEKIKEFHEKVIS